MIKGVLPTMNVLIFISSKIEFSKLFVRHRQQRNCYGFRTKKKLSQLLGEAESENFLRQTFEWIFLGKTYKFLCFLSNEFQRKIWIRNWRKHHSSIIPIAWVYIVWKYFFIPSRHKIAQRSSWVLVTKLIEYFSVLCSIRKTLVDYASIELKLAQNKFSYIFCSAQPKN